MHIMVDRGGEGAMLDDEDVIGEAGEFEKLLNETHALSILVGIVSLSLIVIIVMLCAKCRERKPHDVQLKDVNTVPDKKKGLLPNGVKASGVEDGDVTHRHSNGVHDNRPKSHDRALPELPINGPQDEDDLDPGHYDFIGRKPGANAYDKIQGEPDTDSGGYAGIPSRVNTNSSDLASSANPNALSNPEAKVGQVQHSYATVANIGDAEYAQIAERGNRASRVGSRLSGVGASAAVGGVAAAGGGAASSSRFMDTTTNSSMDTLDGAGGGGAGAGLTPPVVPDRNYEDDDDDENPLPSSSPLLPPRNSAVIEGGDGNHGNGMDVVDGPVAAASGDSVKGPDYTKVTARESLTHIKMRQQEELLAQQQAEYDNYDQIRTPGASGAVCPERSSLTSDLYAEITSGSARSSTYARVGELAPAPTPPPIDSLSRITHTDDDDVDAPDPGYSQITSAARPQSSLSASSGRRSPVYAVVDKSRRRPQTIAADPGEDPADALYSQVHKPGHQRHQSYEPHYSQVSKEPAGAAGGASSSHFSHHHQPPPPPVHPSFEPHYSQVSKEPQHFSHPPSFEPHYSQVNKSGGNGGSNGAVNSAGGVAAVNMRSSFTSNNPDYHSIQDTMLMDDPDYDQVQEVTAPISPPEEFDIDPNYAELQDTAVVVSTSQGQPLLQQQAQQQTTATTTVLRSEPIYQEITEGTML